MQRYGFNAYGELVPANDGALVRYTDYAALAEKFEHVTKERDAARASRDEYLAQVRRMEARFALG